MRFNTDVTFIDTSGQVIARSGDLTLRAENDIIIGSGRALRPELPSEIDLGLDYLPWRILYAQGGIFISRPTIQGSGVLLQGEQGVFGDYKQDAASDGISITSSLVYQNKTSLSTPNLPSGRYRVGWQCEYMSDKASRTIMLRVSVNGSIISEPTPNVGPGVDKWFQVGGYGYVTTSGVQTINLDFSTEAGGGGPSYNASIRNARLEVWRVN